MAKLTDTQAILLAHAAKQDGGSIHPLPPALVDDGGPRERALKAVDQLLARGLIAERETSSAAEVHRTDGDLRFGVFITSIGLIAIGIDDETQAALPAAWVSETLPLARQTKTEMVLSLLRRESGATIAELIDATGWLPHTMRAALTGLRKKGHIVEKAKRDDVTCYRVAA